MRHITVNRVLHNLALVAASVLVLCGQGCASAPSGDSLQAVADFVVEHRPAIVKSEGCIGLRFEEGSPEKGRVALEVYPPCDPEKAPAEKDGR